MNFNYLTFISQLTLWGIPLFLLLILSYLMFKLTKPSDFKKSNFFILNLAKTVYPFWLLLLLVIYTFRFFDGIDFSGSVCWTTSSTKWCNFFLLVSSLLIILFMQNLNKVNLDWTAEVIFAAMTMVFLWTLAAKSTSIFFFLLILEINGLLLLLAFSSLFLISKTSQNVLSNFRQLNKSDSSVLSVLNSLLTFLWTSVFSLLAVLWGFYLSLKLFGSLDFFILEVFQSFKTSPINQHSNISLIFLVFAFTLKFMILPWNSILISFYKTLSIFSFLFYLIFYYLGFLTTALLFFFGSLNFSFGFSGIFFFSAVVIVGIMILVLLKQSFEIRGALAISSILNITFILTTLIFIN